MKKSFMIIFVIAFLIWMLLSWEISVFSVAVGIIVALIVSLTSAGLFETSTGKWLQPKRYFYFIVYILIFLRECIKANIDVARRVIMPTLPINPGIVKVKTSLKSEAALTFLANSITLTPGTLSVDIEKDEGILYIHWIDVKDKDIVKATELIVKKFESIIKKAIE